MKKVNFWDNIRARWDLMPEDQKQWATHVFGAYTEGNQRGYNKGYIKGKLEGAIGVAAAYVIYKQWPKIKEFGKKLFCKEETYTEPEETENDVFDDEIID